MTLAIADLPVVDSHCHLFLPSLETRPLDRFWTLSTLPVPPEDIHSTVFFQMVKKRFAQFLGLSEDAPFEALAEERSALYRADPAGYVERLFADAGLGTLLVDIGYPSLENEGYEVNPDDIKTILPRREVRFVVGVERVLHSLLKRGLSFAGFTEGFRVELARQVAQWQAVAVKSTIAYHTGLDIRPVARDQAERAYFRIVRQPQVNGAMQYGQESRSEDAKVYRDFMLLETIEFCLEHSLPLQLHTGMGAVPAIDVRLSNPLNLRWLISDPHFGRATIVLVHAGYPNHAEAAFLVNTYPNLWLDLSETVPFVGSGVRSRLLEVFEMAPLRKVMYGSDGVNVPETLWFSCVEFKQRLAEALDTLVSAGQVTEEFALESAAGILAANSRRLYGLSHQ
jgi:uncharacterized protein